MTGDDTVRVRAYPDDKERINDLRRGDDTQADVVRRILDGEVKDAADLERSAVDDLRETLERIESAVETIEERTGAIDRTLEDLNR